MARRIFFFEGTKWEIPSKMYCTCSLSFPQAIQGFPLVCQSQSCIVIGITSLVIKRCLILFFSVCRIIFICELSAFVSIVHDIVMRVSKSQHNYYYHLKQFFFIGREPTMWPANNCLQIMVCSCVMPSNHVWLQIIFCTCIKETVLLFFLWINCSCIKMAEHFTFRGYSLKKQTRWSNDKTVIELGYRKILWFVSVSQINCLIIWSARHRQMTIFCSTSSNNH